MRTHALLWGALALAVGCTRHPTEARPHAPVRPTVVAEAPLAPPLTSRPAVGAAEPVRHPRADADDASLGARVEARPLPLPHVALGQSRAFRFEGERHGWVLQLAENAQLTTPAYSHGKVFVGAGFSSSTVYALDATSGAMRWAGSTPDGGPSAAIVDDDTVLFNTESCTLFAFDTKDGRLRWSHYLGDPLMSQPASQSGRVFTAWPDPSAGGFAFGALSSRNGRILWQRPVPGDVMTAPVIVGDSVYFTTMDGAAHRYRARDGRRVWSRALHATSAPAVDGDRVYLAQRAPGGRERQLVLDGASGNVLTRGDVVRAPWTAERPDTGGTEPGWIWEGARPVAADGRVYHAMGDEIVARDVATGREVWRRRNPLRGAQRSVTSPAVVGAQLVVGTRGGDVFGLDIDTGATTWAYRIGEPITVQPVVANGWVYVATARGKVVGFEVADRQFDGWHMWGGNTTHIGASLSEPAPAEAADQRPSQGTLRSATGDVFPLMHTDVGVDVSGPVARVTVTQRFSNPHDHPVDAEYLFPLPSDSAVDAMDLHVGARVIHGTIQRRADARRTYENARAHGRTAALLEQERPNLFRQAVANVRPGEQVEVVLRFVETVPWKNGGYEFVMPLATGSRYTPGAGGATPTRPPGDVGLRATIDLGVDLASVSSPSHDVAVQGTSVTLSQGNALPDRDFILRYAPRVDVVAPSVLARREGDDGFVTLQLHPDPQVADARLTPRELVFVVDTSSSMRGRPMELARAVMRRAIERLRPTDTFRVLRFSDTVSSLAPGALPATDENRRRAIEHVNAMLAAGATEMIPGLRAALDPPGENARMRIAVLLTDGYVGNEREVLAAVQRTLGTSRMFAVGVGSSVNRYLLEELTEIGRGDLQVVTPTENPSAAAERFYATIDRPYLTDVEVDWGSLDVRDVYPRVVPDLYADRPLVVHGRYARGGDGDVTVRGRILGRAWQRTIHVSLPTQSTHDATPSVLPSLWARARIKDLSRAMLLGEVPALRDEVTALGLRFGLVTPYTSFVAVDEAPSAAQIHVPSSGSLGSATSSGELVYGDNYKRLRRQLLPGVSGGATLRQLRPGLLASRLRIPP